MYRLLQTTVASALALFGAACTSDGLSDQSITLNLPSPERRDEAIWAQRGDEQCHTEDTWYYPGGLAARECVLRNIHRAAERAALPENRGAFNDIRRYAQQLSAYYQIRAGRQQNLMDTGGGITQGTAVIAALSDKAGAVTQGYWLTAAFIPVLVSHVNSHEPTRDLFHAGAIGLDFVTMRYTQLERSATMLDALSIVASPPSCAGIGDTLNRVSAWPDADRTVLQPEAQRLFAACNAVDADNANFALALRISAGMRSRWAVNYASDIVELDRLLVIKDQQFRFSPGESLGAIAASPFQAIGTLLSGQNADDALKRLQAAMAFEDMAITLEPALLPPEQAPTQAVTPLSPQALARRTAPRSRGATPSAAAANAAITHMESAIHDLGTAQRANAYRAALLAELYNASRKTHLGFDYSTTNSIVTVTLGPPPPPPPPDQQQTPAPEKP